VRIGVTGKDPLYLAQPRCEFDDGGVGNGHGGGDLARGGSAVGVSDLAGDGAYRFGRDGADVGNLAAGSEDRAEFSAGCRRRSPCGR
jgi:hypothetical protein